MPSDREVLALALPALGALVAEPLYVLGDTAIIGHLGTRPLAGLALAGLLLSEVLGFCTFLEYGTTARAARLYGAGQHEAALDAGVQATWLAIGMGIVLVVVVELAAAPALHAMAGGSTPAAAQAIEWIRIAALGGPFVLITGAAQGWMRGFQNTRTPLYVIGAANLASIFLAILVRKGAPLAPSWARIRRQLASARDLGLRTVAFFIAFTVAASVAARTGDAALAAHQIGAQLWFFTALFLDATAIAAQALIGRLLGAGATDVAHALAHRLLWAGTILGVGFAAVLAAGYEVIPALFTADSPVVDQAHVLWPWLVLMMPLNGWLFALDGVLFGAGDLRFMRNVTVLAALGGYVPIALLTAQEGWGLTGIWIGLAAFICIRTGVGALRYRGRRWLVGGAALADEAA
jgi:Na+-driven multidrug efflux pump